MLIDREYNVLAGHGRIAAAKEEGINEVPCVFVEHLSEAQKKAYILADNRMAMDAGWDTDLLLVEMETLKDMGFDIGMTGFDEKEIADLFETDTEGEKEGFSHPSSKPVPLIVYLIKQCTQTNGLVLDGFLGSATTLIACEQIDRTCYGIELEPKFVDVAIVRYLQYKNNDSSDVYVIRDGQRIDYKDVPKPESMEDNS